MGWIYFVLLTTFLWAMVNVIDKYLIDKRIRSPVIIFIFNRLLSLIPVIFLIFILNTGIPNPGFLLLIFVSAVLMVAGIIIYYKIVEMEEISISIPMFQFIPIFTLFMAFFILGERLTSMDYLGFLILILGGFVISTKRVSGLFRIGRVLWFVILASLIFSASYIIAKFVLNYVNFWETFIWVWVFEIAVTMPILFSGRIRDRFKYYCRNTNRRDWGILFINMIISIIAFASYYFAIKIGPISLIQAAENIQMVFVFIFALLLTRFYPQIMRERFDIRAFVQKISGMILIIIGVLLTQLL